uniref:hypothetical protein n=1 Tax=Streptomyces niveiscabiei TaxID=164115 RepID=UPI0038F7492F
VKEREIAFLGGNQDIIEVAAGKQCAELAIQSRIGSRHNAGSGFQRSSVRRLIAERMETGAGNDDDEEFAIALTGLQCREEHGDVGLRVTA